MKIIDGGRRGEVEREDAGRRRGWKYFCCVSCMTRSAAVTVLISTIVMACPATVVAQAWGPRFELFGRKLVRCVHGDNLRPQDREFGIWIVRVAHQKEENG